MTTLDAHQREKIQWQYSSSPERSKAGRLLDEISVRYQDIRALTSTLEEPQETMFTYRSSKNASCLRAGAFGMTAHLIGRA